METRADKGPAKSFWNCETGAGFGAGVGAESGATGTSRGESDGVALIESEAGTISDVVRIDMVRIDMAWAIDLAGSAKRPPAFKHPFLKSNQIKSRIKKN